MKQLLENGAEVNAKGGEYGSALQAASFRGDKAIVKLLLENGAEVNAKGGEYGNALQAAAASYQSNSTTMQGGTGIGKIYTGSIFLLRPFQVD